MPRSKSGASRNFSRTELVETLLIVALAALVVIKGGAAVGGVFLGLGQMMGALVSLAMQ